MDGTFGHGLVADLTELRYWLHLMVLEVFSNLNDSMIFKTRIRSSSLFKQTGFKSDLKTALTPSTLARGKEGSDRSSSASSITFPTAHSALRQQPVIIADFTRRLLCLNCWVVYKTTN